MARARAQHAAAVGVAEHGNSALLVTIDGLAAALRRAPLDLQVDVVHISMTAMTRGAAYHSPLREEQAAATRARILAACVAIMKSGAELTYRAVADQAGVQERTVYNHFPAKADLEDALWGWIRENLTSVTFSARTEDELLAAMRASFAGFDAGAPLIQAMLHSRQGLEVRLRQQPERSAMFRRVVDDAIPGAPPSVRAKATAAVQVLYSASAWELLRSFWGMDAGQAAEVVELAIRALLEGLRTKCKPRARPRGGKGRRR